MHWIYNTYHYKIPNSYILLWLCRKRYMYISFSLLVLPNPWIFRLIIFCKFETLIGSLLIEANTKILNFSDKRWQWIEWFDNKVWSKDSMIMTPNIFKVLWPQSLVNIFNSLVLVTQIQTWHIQMWIKGIEHFVIFGKLSARLNNNWNRQFYF